MPRMARSGRTGSQGSVRGTRTYQLYMLEMSSREPNWESLAPCRGHDPDSFFFEGMGSKPRLQEMAAFCKRMCRFREECYESATESDKYYTVRGGRLPLALNDGGRTSIPKGVKPDELPNGDPAPCHKGHERVWVRFKGSPSGFRGFCGVCENARKAKLRAKSGVKPKRDESGVCKYGHEGVYRDHQGIRRCRECELIRGRWKKKTGSSAGWNAGLTVLT